ncbi:MAG: hypothetical protein COA94_08855 [Rickettsiales bacterium]|nr:MAG: hypothetical protein COA94_08855 [Rickettsiales bacterium]
MSFRTIPTIIMQTWKNNDIPDHWKESISSIKSKMPKWRHVLMTDEDNRNFISEHFPDFLEYYDKFPHNIQRADAIRPCWLYVHGGIYMDLDLVVQKNLEELLVNSGAHFVASGNISHTITNSFMASEPGNPIWLEYIEQMKLAPPFWAMGKHMRVMTTTGPLCLTRVINESTQSHTILPNKLLMPCSVCNISRCDTTKSYIKPIKGQSWNDWTSHTLNLCMCKWRELLLILALFLLLLISYVLVPQL